MGVRLPIERRPSQSQPERLADGPRRRTHREKDRRTGTDVRRALLFGALALILMAAGVAAAYFLGRVPSPSAIWEVGGAKRLCSGEAGFLMSTPSGLVLGTVDGNLVTAGMTAEQALLVGPSIVTVRDGDLVALVPGSQERPIAESFSDESLLGPGTGCCYTARPKDGITFGANWLLRRVTLTRDAAWEVALAATPITCVEKGDKVFIGANDLSSGTLARLYVVEKSTGRLLWEREIGTGFWRAILTREDGTAIAVTDQSLTALSASGQLLWTYQPPAPIAGAVDTGESIALCYEPVGLTGRLMTPNVALVSSAGGLLWAKAPAKRVVSVAAWAPGAGEGQEPCIVALSESHVIGLSQKDGTELWRIPAGGQPVELKEGFLLVRDRSGLRLVKPSVPSREPSS